MTKRKKRRSRAIIQDSGLTSTSGMGSSCDASAGVTQGNPYQGIAGNYYGQSPLGLFGLQYDQFWCNLYKARWEARKIVDIPAEDMTREGWKWESKSTSADDLEELKIQEEKIGLPGELLKAITYQRLYGGGLVFLGMKKDVDDPTSAADPLDPENVKEGDLAFVRAIPSFQVNASTIEANPLSPNYQRPEVYNIRGVGVHRSRFLVFGGKVLDDPYFSQSVASTRNSRLGFTDSVLLCLYSEILDAKGTRQSVSALLHKLSVMILKYKGVRALRTTQQGNKIMEELTSILTSASNFRGILLDDTDAIEQYTSNAQVGEGLMIAFLQVLSAASDIPATRFLNQAPGGLNATGDSDTRNYFDKIRAAQNNELKHPLLYAGDIMSKAFLGKEISDLKIKFNPLWQMTDKEQAEIRQMDATTITTLVGGPIMMEEDGQQEALERNVVLNELQSFEPPETEPIDLGMNPIPGVEGEGVDIGENGADIRPGT